MKSDDWCYTLLKKFPGFFFELLGEPASTADAYRFDSVELKSQGMRIDGVFLPNDDRHPLVFLEIQGYQAATFYANLFAKVFLYLEKNDPAQSWRAVAIFLKQSMEPAALEPYRMLLDSPSVRRIYLDALPVDPDAPLGVGLWQMLSAPETAVRELVPKVVAKVADIGDRSTRQNLVELIEEILVRRFLSISKEEIQTMLQLPDKRDSRFFKEVLAEGIVVGQHRTEERIARKLYSQNYPLEKIAELTGIEIDKLKELLSKTNPGN